MTIEQLPSGSYRVSQQINGKRYRHTFDHMPTQKEVMLKIADLIKDVPIQNNGAFYTCVLEYIKSKDNILSPTTITSYKQLYRQMPEYLLNKDVNEITQVDIQKAINEYAANHSPKSVKNYHGLIASVLKLYRPDMAIRTTLPKNKPYDPTIPEHDDIIRILDEAKGTEFSIALQLGCLGLRKGEILALNLSDLDRDTLTIDKVMVLNDNGSYSVKNLPKTVSSVRKVVIPDALAEEIREKGYIYNLYPGQLLKALHRIQDKLGIERCRFHDLRHYFASYAHYMGMSDADIMASGGWKTDEVMKRVYRHSMANHDSKKSMANKLLG
jgi:integrase